MKKLAVLVISCLMFVGCTAFNHNVTNRIDATNVDFTTMRKGTDCKYYALGIIPLTNNDIDIAAKKANIRRLRYVENSFSYYVLFGKSCVIVYGN